jgi:hypothetical protein
MHFTITGTARGLFGSGNSSKNDSTKDTEDHAYIKGDPDTRGPCPGLNALANQGYL